MIPKVCGRKCFKAMLDNLSDGSKDLADLKEILWLKSPVDYKSKLEETFAVELTELGIWYVYEPFVYNKKYVPDFLIERSAIIEVKGVWEPGALRKVRRLQEYLKDVVPVYVANAKFIRRISGRG